MTNKKTNTLENLGLSLAYYASMYAQCTRLRVGAIITDAKNKNIISAGFNSPSLPFDTEETCDKLGCFLVDGHCLRTIHAEDHALRQAHTLGRSVVGGTLYLTHRPCLSCTKNVLNAGIKKIIVAHWGDRGGTKVDDYVEHLLADHGATMVYQPLLKAQRKEILSITPGTKDYIFPEEFDAKRRELEIKCNFINSSFNEETNVLYKRDLDLDHFKPMEDLQSDPDTHGDGVNAQTDVVELYTLPDEEKRRLIRHERNLKEFANDPDELIRSYVAKAGYELEKLATDKSWLVRANVVKSGYITKTLEYDTNYRVLVAIKDYRANNTTMVDTNYSQWH